jgi:uncharacterized membrane protein
MDKVKASTFFSAGEKAAIEAAIQEAEKNTSGEIRLHVETRCTEEALDRAAYWFAELKMHKTEQRNGVLFYLAIADHKFAILGDLGINAKVPTGFWDEVSALVLADFKEQKFAQGLIVGIHKAGENLKAFFPYQSDDVNELSDEISFGK